jgi:hypothetical protein
VAALAGVELDDLIHRDAQRQTRRTVAVGASAAAAALVVGVLTTLTLTARAETERKRDQATGMVDHMLTDVRKNLQRTGRLDQLAAVNETAMAYYRGQDLAKLTDDELQQRAKLLHAMGEDDEKRGDLAKARAAFVEAHRTTAELLAKKPSEPQRLYDHAQSEYWVGFAAWREGDGAEAKGRFEAYAELAERLVVLEPGRAEWRREIAYSQLNLSMLALRRDGDGEVARRHADSALNELAVLATQAPGDIDALRDLIDAYAWRADGYRVAGNLNAALASRSAQRALIDQALRSSPKNAEIRLAIINNEIAIARLQARLGNSGKAQLHLGEGAKVAAQLLAGDNSNADIAIRARAISLLKIYVSMQASSGSQVLRSSKLNCDASDAASRDAEVRTLCHFIDNLPNAGREKSIPVEIFQGTYLPGDRYSQRWGFDFRSASEGKSIL